MPCWTITTAEINLGKVDEHLLTLALAALKITRWTYDKNSGTLTVNGRRASTELTAQIKQAYSRQVVLGQAKRYGWKITEVSANKFEVIKG